MTNETEVKQEAEIKDAEVMTPAVDAAAEPAAETIPAEPLKIVVGRVAIDVTATGLKVEAPQNLLLALAVLKAGEAFLQMQYQDALRSQMGAQPKILRPGAAAPGGMGDMMKRLSRPS